MLTAHEDGRVELNGLSLQALRVSGRDRLLIAGFSKESDAREFLPKLAGAVLQLVVEDGFSLIPETRLQTVNMEDAPIDIQQNPNFRFLVATGWTHLDGWIHSSPAAIVPDHLRITEYGAGDVHATIQTPAARLLKRLAENLGLRQPDAVARDARLSLAIELYATALGESGRARLVSLTTSLETLLPPAHVAPRDVQLLEKALTALSDSDETDKDPESAAAVKRVRARIAALKRESISAGLRRMAREHALELEETEDEAERNIKNAYDVRSSLLHSGHAEEPAISAALNWLDVAVPRILRRLAIALSTGRTTHIANEDS